MTTRYEEKIRRIRAGEYRKGDFIIADAKDADMSGGALTAGRRRDAKGQGVGIRTRAEFLAEIRALIAQDVVDIMLCSASNMELLQEEGAFDGTRVTPAFRANDTTDVWGNVRNGTYRQVPSIPYRGADLPHARARLCLYSVTFNNNAAADVASLEAYRAFRREIALTDKKHFLEIFNPNMDLGLGVVETGQYVNDCILRTLASMNRAERPEFLKLVYNGPAALEELAGHDPSVTVGVLGGSGGTHRDTFELVAQAEKYGARVALFGRKINNAEHQPTFITWLRRVADGETDSKEAVRGYRADLERMGFGTDRSLEDDLAVTEAPLKIGLSD
jgi:hypothetical protein